VQYQLIPLPSETLAQRRSDRTRSRGPDTSGVGASARAAALAIAIAMLCVVPAHAQDAAATVPAAPTAAASGTTAAAEPAADASTERLEVADAYLELHTGPGRGYPVFFVVPRGDFVEIELRRTDWYRVRTAGGKEGWVHRRQLETTLTAAGGAKSFRDVLVDDYLRRRVELGAAWGQFDSAPMLKVWTAFRFTDTLSIEGTIGQVQGSFSGTDFWHIGINAEPWSEQRLSPYLGIGVGKFKNVPNQSLVDASTTNANLAHATAGLRYYLSDRFVARVDYTLYTAFISDNDTTEYDAYTIGLSFFF
jgi:uncharacterized protein YraI